MVWGAIIKVGRGLVPAIGMLCASQTAASAESFLQELNNAVENHGRVKAAYASTEATRQRVRVSKSLYFPKLNLKSSRGREAINNPKSPDTTMTFNNASAEVTQRLWDFGATRSKVHKAKLRVARAELGVLQTRQEVMFQAIRAALSVKRSLGVLQYAQRSEGSVRRQAGMEQSMVQSGSGNTADVLQARTQLTGAKTRRVHAERAKMLALNNYRHFFGTTNIDLRRLRVLESVRKEIPTSVDQALNIAAQNNVNMQIARIDTLIAESEIKQTRRSEFLPKIDLIGKSEFSENVSGTEGVKRSASIKVQLSMPINLGFTSVNKVRANQHELEAASFKLADARLQVEEDVLNAWAKYETAVMSASLLKDQATLAHGFLELAKEERALGNRSLIDVISGETAHFNALSDAAAAQADVLLAAFEILKATGQLGVSNFKGSQQRPMTLPKAKPGLFPSKEKSKNDAWSTLR